MIIATGFWGRNKLPVEGMELYFDFKGSTEWQNTGPYDVKDLSPRNLKGDLHNTFWVSDGGGAMRFMTVNGAWINPYRTSNGGIGIYYGSWSVAFVAKTPDLTGTKFILGGNTSPTYSNNAYAGFETNKFFYTHSTGTYPVAPGLAINTWYHVVVTYDYPTYNASIYVNGLLVASGHQERMITVYNVYFGQVNGSYGNFDLGLIMAYNRVLSQKEIKKIFNIQKGRFGL